MEGFERFEFLLVYKMQVKIQPLSRTFSSYPSTYQTLAILMKHFTLVPTRARSIMKQGSAKKPCLQVAGRIFPGTET